MFIACYLFFIDLRMTEMEKLFRNPGNQSVTVESKKTWHKKQILKALYFGNAMPNSNLSKILDLSTPKINSLLQELIEEGLVEDLGRGDSSGGRRPNLYGLVADGFYVTGISISVNQTVISVFNSKNEEVSGPHYFPIKIQPDISVFQKVKTELEKVIAESKIPEDKILVTGIELPGLINLKKGTNKTYFPEEENLFEKLQEIFGTRVFFNHDAKIRTFAEQHFGLAQGRKHVLMLQADWGLGLGIISNGKPYSGKSGYSGEFGHLPIVDNGVLCNCGKNGCLETAVSAIGIARMAKEGIAKGSPSLITDLVNGDLNKIDISIITKAANLGDQFAISLFASAGQWLGRGIAFLIQIFNPELVIIGGSVAQANQFILNPVLQSVHTFCNPEISKDTEIRFSELGDKAATLGIAAYALEKLSMIK